MDQSVRLTFGLFVYLLGFGEGPIIRLTFPLQAQWFSE